MKLFTTYYIKKRDEYRLYYKQIPIESTVRNFVLIVRFNGKMLGQTFTDWSYPLPYDEEDTWPIVENAPSIVMHMFVKLVFTNILVAGPN